MAICDKSHGFLIGIFFGSTFSNTFNYLWNFYGTIFFTFSLPSLIFLSNFFFIIYFYLSLFVFFTFLILFHIFFLCSMFSFTTRFLSQSSGHLVIFISPISQFISGLCTCNQGISNITSVFPRLHISILILST